MKADVDLFVEAGLRAHVVWGVHGSYTGQRDNSTEIVNPPGGGSEGIWVEPLRIADTVDFAIQADDSEPGPLHEFASDFRREDGVACITYPDVHGLRIEKRVWVPVDEPAVVVELQARLIREEAPRNTTISGSTRFRLAVGWPVGDAEIPRLVRVAAGAVRAASSFGEGALLLAPHSSEFTFPEAPNQANDSENGSTAAWQWSPRLEPGERFVGRVVVAGGTDAVTIARRVAANTNALEAKRRDRWRQAMVSAPRLRSDDPAIDEAFESARPLLDDFKHEDLKIGLGLFAGFPAYNFYFSGDAFRTLYGAVELGDWDDTREVLRTIMRGQRPSDEGDQLRGELWHELSTTGHALSPNFSTLELPSIVLHYVRWSGDVAFAREALPAAVLAAEWAIRKDLDRDGLPDNGPEQTFADGAREDLNAAGAHIAPALWQARCFRDVAALAAIAGDVAASRRWHVRARTAWALVEETFWDGDSHRIAETIRPDGFADIAPGFVPAVEPADAVSSEFRSASLANELQEERTLAGGALRSEAFAQHRQARAYYVMERGDRARRLLEGGYVEEGGRALRAIASLSRRGYMPEIASRAENEGDSRGCFHQAWSIGYSLVHPLIRGVFGLDPDATRGEITITPRLPSYWTHLRLDRVRFGDNVASIELIRTDKNITLTCQAGAGPGFTLRTPGHRARSIRPGQRVSLHLKAALTKPRRLSTQRPALSTPHAPRRPTSPPEVVYCGFLAPPFAAERSVHHVPANYAVRHPDRLLETLAHARVLVLTDQQDALFTPELTVAIDNWLRRRGALLFSCYWSAAWGRGFWHTYNSIGNTSLADLLPLEFEDCIERVSTRPLLLGDGERLWSDLPWRSAPPLDVNAARLRPAATCLARTENGLPLVATWRIGNAQRPVLTFAADLFGFGHGTVVHWPGQRMLFERALDWLLESSR